MNLSLILAFFLLITATAATTSAAPVKTYVAPFTVTGVEKQEELRTTIQSLLLSRLASEKISPLTSSGGADVKVTGSYLSTGSFFSIDAAVENSGSAIIGRAFVQGKTSDDLIPAISTLATALSEKILGKDSQQVVSAREPASDIVKAPDVKPESTGIAIHRLKGAITGMAVGLTDSSGKRELFVAERKIVRAFLLGSELKQVGEIQYKSYQRVVAVDTADCDQDSKPELYVTVLENEKLMSEIWKLDNGVLKQIAGSLPYYFRAVAGAGGIRKLYAQQMTDREDFYGDVSEVVLAGTTLTLKNPLKLPSGAYLYNFTRLTAGNESVSTLYIDRSGTLRVLNSDGNELWKSPEAFGGSEVYFSRTGISNLREESGSRQVYLEQRMIQTPGKEILIPQNRSSWLMKGKHSYSNSSLYAFTWNGSDLTEKWHTRETDYYLADFAYDEQRRELLMLEVLTKEDGVFSRPESRLVIRRVE